MEPPRNATVDGGPTRAPRTSRMRRSLVAALPLALLVAACDSLLSYDELTLSREPYTGTELRLDGYYAFSGPTDDGERFAALFLYRDGVVRYGGSSVGRDVLESKFEEYGDRRYDWGVFLVDGDRIQTERWYPGDGSYTPAIIQSGRILNDTTFTITPAQSDGEATPRDLVYRFRRFAPKPASANAFVR